MKRMIDNSLLDFKGNTTIVGGNLEVDGGIKANGRDITSEVEWGANVVGTAIAYNETPYSMDVILIFKITGAMEFEDFVYNLGDKYGLHRQYTADGDRLPVYQCVESVNEEGQFNEDVGSNNVFFTDDGEAAYLLIGEGFDPTSSIIQNSRLYTRLHVVKIDALK